MTNNQLKGLNMMVNAVPLRRALHWIYAGWRCFANNIGAWVAMSLLFFIISIVLIMIPRVGIFILVFLLPVMCAGLLHSAHHSFQGISPQVEDISYGFKNKEHRLNLLLLGSMMLLYLFGLVLALYPLSGALFQSLYAIHDQNQESGVGLAIVAYQFIHNHPLIIWAQSLAVLGGLAAFGYTISLILFTKTGPLKAIYFSLQAFVHNLTPIAMLISISMLLIGLATFALGIGFLVVLPVLIGANYASYLEIFSPVTEELAAV